MIQYTPIILGSYPLSEINGETPTNDNTCYMTVDQRSEDDSMELK